MSKAVESRAPYSDERANRLKERVQVKSIDLSQFRTT
jgi:hypothetical protein